MKKNVLFILSVIIASSMIIAGVGYAWNAKSSDVADPTPIAGTSLLDYRVVGDSMEPTIASGDLIEVNTRATEYVPGEIVILRYPKDPSILYCRRIAGVSGDKVIMQYFSNVKLTTVYSASHPAGVVYPKLSNPSGDVNGEYKTTVLPGTAYVVGDNAMPGDSYDSDQWGLLPLNDIVGVVTRRLSPDPQNF
jgi:signal peptidase I